MPEGPQQSLHATVLLSVLGTVAVGVSENQSPSEMQVGEGHLSSDDPLVSRTIDPRPLSQQTLLYA